MTESLQAKRDRLHDILTGMDSILVAYSGGVDSAFLACAATEVRPDRVLCVTADSPSYPRRHRELAVRVATDFHLQHEFIQTAEIENPAYRANEANRCYHCKHELYTQLSALARQRGFAVVADGSNADDRGDYRPGRQAAREFGVRSPLDEADLTKDDIRALSREMGLSTADEPASACLSSRIPYASEVTEEKLRMIEQSEDVLRRLGFRICRVRHHDTLARLEIDRNEMARALDPEVNAALVRELKAIGYKYVSLDLQGYRMGSLNEVLRLIPA